MFCGVHTAPTALTAEPEQRPGSGVLYLSASWLPVLKQNRVRAVCPGWADGASLLASVSRLNEPRRRSDWRWFSPVSSRSRSAALPALRPGRYRIGICTVPGPLGYSGCVFCSASVLPFMVSTAADSLTPDTGLCACAVTDNGKMT